jgi:hypothetical protein
MNDTEAADLLERAARVLVPDEPAPLTSLVTAAHQGHRRRTRMTVALAAASVALVLGGGAVVQQVVANRSETPPTDPTTGVPVAPDGMRLVGMGRVVIAVPDSWGTQALRCGRPTRDTVYFLDRAPLCGGQSQRGISSVLLLDAGTEEGQRAADFTDTDAAINGVDVKRGQAECPPAADCDFPFEEVVWVPAYDVVLAVLPGGDDGGVLESLQLLPADYTTVPYLPANLTNGPAGNLLIAAGLTFEESPPPGMPTGRAGQFGTDPQAGSVVRRGTTVSMLLEPFAESTCDKKGSGSSPEIPGGPDYPTNASGQTYGAMADGDYPDPDLIAVSGNCDLSGYVTREELDDPAPWEPEAGLAAAASRTIPVYESDGVTQIDTFTIGGAEGQGQGSETPSGPDAAAVAGEWTITIAGAQREDGSQQYDTYRDVNLTALVAGDRLTVFDGCQTWATRFQLKDGEFALTGPFAAQTTPPTSGCDQQAPLVNILENIRHVTIQGDEVYLHLDSFQIVLVLRR